MWLVETPDEEVEKDEFKESFGTLLEEMDLKKDFYCRYYYPLYMMRRIVYSLLLVIGDGYPMIQLIIIPPLLCFPVFLLIATLSNRLDAILYDQISSLCCQMGQYTKCV